MIKIRYSSEFAPGLHGQAERHGRRTVISLLPGLTPGQRQAVLRRLRQQGRMGIGPRLPAPQLALAQLADRVRSAFGQAAAIIHAHPAGSTLPVVVLSAAAVGLLVLSTVSVRVIHRPEASGPGPVFGAGPTATVGSGSVPRPPRNGGQRPPARPGTAPAQSPGSSGSGAGPGAGPGAGGGSRTSSGPGATSGAGSGGTTLTGTAATSPPPPASASAAPAVSPAPGSATPSPSPSPAGTPRAPGSGLCVDIGPFGICLRL